MVQFACRAVTAFYHLDREGKLTALVHRSKFDHLTYSPERLYPCIYPVNIDVDDNI